MSDPPLTAKCDLSLTWTGDTAVVFGGIETCGRPNVIADGSAALYHPDTNVWVLLEARLMFWTASGDHPSGARVLEMQGHDRSAFAALWSAEPRGVLVRSVGDRQRGVEGCNGDSSSRES